MNAIAFQTTLPEGQAPALAMLPMAELISICRQDDHPDCEAAREIYHERTAPPPYDAYADDWANYDRVKRSLASWRD